jgi:hypothetical protein
MTPTLLTVVQATKKGGIPVAVEKRPKGKVATVVRLLQGLSPCFTLTAARAYSLSEAFSLLLDSTILIIYVRPGWVRGSRHS